MPPRLTWGNGTGIEHEYFAHDTSGCEWPHRPAQRRCRSDGIHTKRVAPHTLWVDVLRGLRVEYDSSRWLPRPACRRLCPSFSAFSTAGTSRCANAAPTARTPLVGGSVVRLVLIGAPSILRTGS
eukprot:7341350-Prymnesium_polylepis.1